MDELQRLVAAERNANVRAHLKSFAVGLLKHLDRHPAFRCDTHRDLGEFRRMKHVRRLADHVSGRYRRARKRLRPGHTSLKRRDLRTVVFYQHQRRGFGFVKFGLAGRPVLVEAIQPEDRTLGKRLCGHLRVQPTYATAVNDRSSTLDVQRTEPAGDDCTYGSHTVHIEVF